MIYLTKMLGVGAIAVCGSLTLGAHDTSGSESTSVVELTAVSDSPDPSVPRDIDLALCLDTSGSMSGLIDSARQRLWALVNDLALAEPTPRIRVALLTYGSPDYGIETGYVRVNVPLTEDLDMVSLKLFELSTSGGDEFVARVTQTAATQLEWSKSLLAMKMIVVAGNEGAEQDAQVSLELACGLAIEQGIVVNALYCAQGNGGGQLIQNRVQTARQRIPGPATSSATPSAPRPLDSIALGWKKVSSLADGAFAMIDQNSGVLVIETPFDEKLIALSSALNETYIAYGNGADWNLDNQMRQDSNAVDLNRDAAAERAQTKAGKLYFCGWDLVDSLGRGELALADIKTADLPQELRLLTPEELKVHINDKREAREKVQVEIAAVGVERETWLITKRAELGADGAMGFDSPLRKAFRELAEARGFQFAKPKKEVVKAADPETKHEAEAAPVTRNW